MIIKYLGYGVQGINPNPMMHWASKTTIGDHLDWCALEADLLRKLVVENGGMIHDANFLLSSLEEVGREDDLMTEFVHATLDELLLQPVGVGGWTREEDVLSPFEDSLLSDHVSRVEILPPPMRGLHPFSRRCRLPAGVLSILQHSGFSVIASQLQPALMTMYSLTDPWIS